MDALAVAGRTGKAVWLTQIVRLTTADFTLRLTTGGFVIWGNELFIQRDRTFGTLADLPTFEDGIDSQTTRVDLGFYPADDLAMASMADRKHQSSLIEVYDCSLDGDTGLLVGEPDLLFQGETDLGRVVIGQTTELIWQCETEDALLNEPNEDRRLSDPFHQSIWPGELGLIHVTGIGRKIYWRANAPAGSISGGGGYVGGGGGGGGGVISEAL